MPGYLYDNDVEALYYSLNYGWLDRYPCTARLLRNMLADEGREKPDETKSLCGWDPRDDDDTISRVSVYATLPRKSKWGSLRSLFSRKSEASLDLTEDDIETGEEGEIPKKPEKRGFRRSKSSTSISSCPPDVISTKPRKQKAYRKTRSSTQVRPLGVWAEEDPSELQEENEQENDLQRNEPRKLKSYFSGERKSSIFSSRTSLVSLFSKKDKQKEEDIPVKPLILPVEENKKKVSIRDYDSHRYKALATEDEVSVKAKNRLSLDFGKSRNDKVYQNGSVYGSSYTPTHNPTRVDFNDRSWRTRSMGSARKRIVSDETYLYKLREILHAYPTRGPPYAMSMLCYHLYMGSQKNADDIGLLRRFGITHVLNMAGTRKMTMVKNPYKPNSGVQQYLMIPAQDYEDYDIARHFDEAIGFLDHAKRNGGKALVHCNMGVNRSGAICAAYLMVDQKMYLLEVAKLLKLKRNFALVNPGFQKQMVQFAKQKNMLDPL